MVVKFELEVISSILEYWFEVIEVEVAVVEGFQGIKSKVWCLNAGVCNWSLKFKIGVTDWSLMLTFQAII